MIPKPDNKKRKFKTNFLMTIVVEILKEIVAFKNTSYTIIKWLFIPGMQHGFNICKSTNVV